MIAAEITDGALIVAIIAGMAFAIKWYQDNQHPAKALAKYLNRHVEVRKDPRKKFV